MKKSYRKEAEKKEQRPYPRHAQSKTNAHLPFPALPFRHEFRPAKAPKKAPRGLFQSKEQLIRENPARGLPPGPLSRNEFPISMFF